MLGGQGGHRQSRAAVKDCYSCVRGCSVPCGASRIISLSMCVCVCISVFASFGCLFTDLVFGRPSACFSVRLLMSVHTLTLSFEITHSFIVLFRLKSSLPRLLRQPHGRASFAAAQRRWRDQRQAKQQRRRRRRRRPGGEGVRPPLLRPCTSAAKQRRRGL